MVGRDEQLKNLNHYYGSEENHLTVLYGRHRIGKTAILKELMQDRVSVYFHAVPAVEFEQIENLNRTVAATFSEYQEAHSFLEIFENARIAAGGPLILVVEEFQNLVKAGTGFMEAVEAVIIGGAGARKIMVVLVSSSIAWVENSMVSAIGKAAFSIQAFMKIKEISYVDTVSMFPDTEIRDNLSLYAVTGGVAGYMAEWSQKGSARENIMRLFLSPEGRFYDEAELFIRDEFRETGVYNTILGCLASGKNKLNEIHEYTGFGRDKISVYLKNLMEREIVEKIFSYDAAGNEHTRKGIYRIKDAFVQFWFRFVYPYRSQTSVLAPEVFFQKYLEPGYQEFLLDAFIKIADEFLDIMSSMGRLPLQAEKRGAWHGKTGDLHLIYEDQAGKAIIGQAFTGTAAVDTDALQALKERSVLAGIQGEYYYLFSTSGFTQDLKALEGDFVTLIGIEEL